MYDYPGDPDDLDVDFPDDDVESAMRLDYMTFELAVEAIDACPHGCSWDDCDECIEEANFNSDADRESGWRLW